MYEPPTEGGLPVRRARDSALYQLRIAEAIGELARALGIVRDWLGDPDGDSPNVDYGDDTFPGLLLFGQKRHAVCEKIARAIIAASGGAARLRAELPAADFLGTTAGVSFDTVKTCWTTEP